MMNETRLTHGGDWAGYETEYGTRPLDFSSNVSPLGLPEGVRRAVELSLGDSALYPDPLCRALRQALGEHLGIPPGHILCGNGAADLIYRLAFALKAGRALITAPAFSEYGAALAAAGTEITEYPLREENDFIPQEDILSFITPGIDAVFLCEPSNPAGVLAGRELLLKVLDKCREAGAVLALDECFSDFLDEPEEHTLLPWLEGGSLVIFRAFTKFYAMAGLRCGWCMSADEALLEKMRLAGAPWNVSTPAQAAGIAALKEKEYGERLRALNKREREFLHAELLKLGLRVIPGQADFFLFKSEDEALDEKLRSRGILIRSCENYSGLGRGWYRAAVKERGDNVRLIEALGEALKIG